MSFREVSGGWGRIEEVKSYYDEKAESYDEVFGTLYFRVYDVVTWKFLEPYVPVEPDALILDAGGGTGRWSIRMARKGCRVVLLDASEGMLRVAARRVEDEGLQRRVIVKKGDIAEGGFGDETFDMVLCEHALFLFEEPDVVLRELRRVLKKKCRLIISAQNRYVQSLSSLSDTPSADNVDRAFRILAGREHQCMTTDGEVKIYAWSPDEFRAMLERNGFFVEKVVGKVVTMPLRIKKEVYLGREFSEDLFDKILQFELALCERQDALALAGHFQVIAYKP